MWKCSIQTSLFHWSWSAKWQLGAGENGTILPRCFSLYICSTVYHTLIKQRTRGPVVQDARNKPNWGGRTVRLAVDRVSYFLSPDPDEAEPAFRVRETSVRIGSSSHFLFARMFLFALCTNSHLTQNYSMISLTTLLLVHIFYHRSCIQQTRNSWYDGPRCSQHTYQGSRSALRAARSIVNQQLRIR